MNLRDLEHVSIYDFLTTCGDHFAGKRVLDMGSGREPYRELIQSLGGEYTPYDAPGFPASTTTIDTTGAAFGRSFDTILCTQVIQYVPRPEAWLFELRARFAPHAYRTLVMTYPTNWPEVEPDDLWRFTKHGMARALTAAGYTIERHEQRAKVYLRRADMRESEADAVALGYGVVARA